ncbi:MAG: hypothetical protein K6G54_03065 [Oscillospiraceae bacterium]|nr:hypothetical protein [Oscillospiraceae bacterium]
MTEYELWLDESGDFEAETQSDRRRNPSLVGGILIRKGALSDARIRQLADPDNRGDFHATEMSAETAQRVVPVALEGVCNAGGKLVYFQNTERIDYHTNRDLYLRVLASGLAQLTKYLSTQGHFTLNITVAVRFVEKEPGSEEKRAIAGEEYRRELKSYIAHEFEDINFTLDPHDRIALTILSARREFRLFLADYACNAKLVLNSRKYRPVRDRLLALFDPRYQFTVTALTAENSIRAKLAANDVSGALMEYFTARGKLSKKKMLNEILKRFCAMSYRLQRLQLREFSAALRAYAGKETDFERSESLMKEAIERFFGELARRHIPVQTDESLFWLQLSLADMYLREGDVLHAKPMLDALEQLIRGMNYRVENLAHLYFYRDKKALYEIDTMDYAAAVKTMDATIHAMEGLFAALDRDPLVADYFGADRQLYSEYLGNAYCMKIYAELFLQRQDASLYDRSLRADTDKALSQYRYSGELERNQQYRAKAENEAGHCRAALEWLLKTKDLTLDGENVKEPCVRYLTAAREEDPLSRDYYAMYYVEIMEHAARLGQDALADAMYAALVQEKETLNDLILPRKPAVIRSDAAVSNIVYADIFSDGKAPRRYHPREIVLWKYGAYQMLRGNDAAASRCWEDAVTVCDENPDYTQLKLVAIAVRLEELSLLTDKTDLRARRREIKRRAKDILKLPDLPEGLAAYARDALSLAESPALNTKHAYALSQRIAF